MKEGVYLFYGGEHFLKEQALKEVSPPPSGGLDHEVYDAKQDYDRISDALGSLPFLSDKRTVVIKDIERLPESKKDSFLGYLKKPPGYIRLILLSAQPDLEDAFLRSISRYANTRSFRKPDKRELKNWIYKKLRQEGKAIERGALELFLELKGNDNLAVISNELAKLVAYKGKAGTIEREDVAKLVGRSIAKRVFDLVDAIGAKDKKTALSLMRDFSSGTRREFPELLGVMGWQFRKILKTKILLTEKKDKHSITRQLNVSGFKIDKFINQAGRFEEARLKEILSLIVETDHRIKRGHSNPQFLLERLITELCGA